MGVLTDDMKRVVREQRLGFVATVCADGTPNLSPKGTTDVWDDDHLFFADLRSPQTIRNLRLNPAIEINVVDQEVRKGYRFKGTAVVLTEGEQYDYALELLEFNREMDAARVRAIVLMTVKDAKPLISPAYDWGATEERVRGEWQRYWDEVRASRPSRTN
jgi:predicted pyridoxine 5'-phosphate oxidase superfamily flavin-nucleotide-binding protein